MDRLRRRWVGGGHERRERRARHFKKRDREGYAAYRDKTGKAPVALGAGQLVPAGAALRAGQVFDGHER